MALQSVNMCRMCLKEDNNEEFVPLKRSPDLKLKFFDCFNVAINDHDHGENLLCSPCISQLNSFYNLKNHVQRADSVYFTIDLNPKVSKSINVQEVFKKPPQEVENAQPKAEERIAKFFLQVPNDRTNENMQQMTLNDNLAEIPATPLNRYKFVPIPFFKQSSPSSLDIKQEPVTSDQLKVVRLLQTNSSSPVRRGKARGEIGKLIYKDTATNRYPCVYCEEKTYGSYQSIYSHIKCVHVKKFSCACDFCGKGFFSKASLRSHIETNHNHEYRYTCKHCQRPFKAQTALNAHIYNSHCTRNSM